MKPRKTLSAYVLLVGVMGLSIVGGILAFQIFSAATKSQVTTEQSKAVKPIDGTINPEVIDNLSKRDVITEQDLGVLSVVVTPVLPATPEGQVTPLIATTSSTLTP